jgi:hypothetical protein
MCQILVMAKNHWMESVDRSGWSEKQLAAYDVRITLGDIMAVAPDDHIWGTDEGPPNHILVKIPGLTVEEAKQYIQRLMGSPTIEANGRVRPNMVKQRRYSVPVNLVNSIMDQGGIVEISKGSFNFNLIDKAV